MSHYVCASCEGRSDVAKVCETDGCAKFGQPLAACDCADEQHSAVLKAAETGEDTVINNQ